MYHPDLRHLRGCTCLPEWLEAVTPARAVVSVGVDNMDGHPDGGALRRLEAGGVEVSRTDRDGDVVMELGVDRTEVSRPRRVPRAVSGSPDRS